MGINKVEELANCDVQVLSERFGKLGLWMKHVANGLDFGDVRDREGVKSISRHGTFEEDTSDPIKISESLEMLVGSVHSTLIKHLFFLKQ